MRRKVEVTASYEADWRSFDDAATWLLGEEGSRQIRQLRLEGIRAKLAPETLEERLAIAKLFEN